MTLQVLAIIAQLCITTSEYSRVSRDVTKECNRTYVSCFEQELTKIQQQTSTSMNLETNRAKALTICIKK